MPSLHTAHVAAYSSLQHYLVVQKGTYRIFDVFIDVLTNVMFLRQRIQSNTSADDIVTSAMNEDRQLFW